MQFFFEIFLIMRIYISVQMENSLLQKYRSDRRKLLEFIMSAGLVREIRTPPGAVELRDVDLDTVSIDYVLECVQQGILSQ